MSESVDYSSLLVPSTAAPEALAVETLFIPIFTAADIAPDRDAADAATGGDLTRAVASGEFRNGLYETLIARVTAPGWAPRRLVFIGAGAPADADALRMRRVGAAAGLVAARLAVESAGFVVRGLPDPIRAAAHVADGLGSSCFDMGRYKKRPEPEPRQWTRAVVTVAGADLQAVTQAVREGAVMAEATEFTRTLAHEPGNLLHPEAFASAVRDRLSTAGLSVEVLDEARLATEGMRLLLAVGQGSARPPRLVVIRHDPPGADQDRVIGLVGKGVTFDTGGISLKPPAAMDRMKGDMAGGAAVAGAMLAVARLGAPHRVVAVIPMAENMPGQNATRPGDVIKGANGTTVEIINTDAEGRLILADALWYARKLGATHVVDVATLTGACVVALGHSTSALFGNDEGWVQRVRDVAALAGDRVWPLPIYEEAADQLKSEIADLVNSAGRVGGAVTAAAFLQAFAGDGPWAHLDIAGTAWAEKAGPYEAKGATGAPVRLLTALARWGVSADSPSGD